MTNGINSADLKKENNKDCNNYTGITLLITAMKIFEQTIDRRIETTVENTLEESKHLQRANTSKGVFADDLIAKSENEL